MKYRVIQKSRPNLTYPDLTEKEKVAHENDPHLAGKYTYTPIEEPKKKEAPAEAKKAKSDT